MVNEHCWHSWSPTETDYQHREHKNGDPPANSTEILDLDTRNWVLTVSSLLYDRPIDQIRSIGTLTPRVARAETQQCRSTVWTIPKLRRRTMPPSPSQVDGMNLSCLQILILLPDPFHHVHARNLHTPTSKLLCCCPFAYSCLDALINRASTALSSACLFRVIPALFFFPPLSDLCFLGFM